MASIVNTPLLRNHPPVDISKDATGKGVPMGHLAVKDLLCRNSRSCRLPDDLVAVIRVHRGIAIAMEDDRRRGSFAIGCYSEPTSLSHRDESGGKIAGSAAGETRVYTNCSIQIEVCRSHHGCSSAAGRQTPNIDALWIDRIVPHNLACNA